MIDRDLADAGHRLQRPALLGADQEQERQARGRGVPDVAAVLRDEPRLEEEIACDTRGVAAGGQLGIRAPRALAPHVGDDGGVGLGGAEGGQERAGQQGESGRGAAREHGGHAGR